MPQRARHPRPVHLRRAASAPNEPGIHLLSDRRAVKRLVRSADVGAGDLVVEFGAGAGALTGPLAATGARIIAVERDPRFAAVLRRRFAEQPGVRVVEADARTVALPRRPFAVVASIPYAISTALLRRLLGQPGENGTCLAAADLVVEWGFAKRVAGPPRDLQAAWWQTRFELSVAARVPPSSFRPPPSVASAHLVIRRRPDMPAEALRLMSLFLREWRRRPARPAKDVLGAHVPRKRAHRLLTSTGIDPPAPVASVPIDVWRRIAKDVAEKKTFSSESRFTGQGVRLRRI